MKPMRNTTAKDTLFLALNSLRVITYDWHGHGRPTAHGRRMDQVVEWGRSESIDPDNVGDIADEGIAHRG